VRKSDSLPVEALKQRREKEADDSAVVQTVASSTASAVEYTKMPIDATQYGAPVYGSIFLFNLISTIQMK
jgi:hypothetical protein